MFSVFKVNSKVSSSKIALVSMRQSTNQMVSTLILKRILFFLLLIWLMFRDLTPCAALLLITLTESFLALPDERGVKFWSWLSQCSTCLIYLLDTEQSASRRVSHWSPLMPYLRLLRLLVSKPCACLLFFSFTPGASS